MNDDRDGGRPAVGADLVLPALAAAFAIYFFASVWNLSWEAKTNATIIGVTLLGLIGLLLVRIGIQVARDGATLGIGRLIEPQSARWPRLAIIGCCIAFIFVLPWLGLTLGLFILVAALMVIMRAGTWRAIAATSTIVSGIAYLLFIALLNSRLPRGPVEKLLSLAFGGG
ncbi:MAG: tripartite tricarboxylate transporter TctB family protein [Rhodospirillales bacterium]|nr:tripartite tricarboxylate transporter TctB family protein [Rhodospirillales bacterium]